MNSTVYTYMRVLQVVPVYSKLRLYK